MIPSNRMIALTVAALLSASPAALAQTAQTPGQAPAAPGAQAPGAGKALPASGAAVRVEARIKQLHTQLGITPAQDAQWQQFAQTMRDNAREMDQVVQQRAQQFSSMNALQDLQSYEQIAEAHVQHLQKLIPAFQELYASMSPEQKTRADEVFRARTENRAQTGSGHNG
jgi:protein CpxP